MKPFVFPSWTNYLPFIIASSLVFGGMGVTGFVWYYFSPEFTDVGYTPQQPVPFSHKLHAGELGMSCYYCHNTVERSGYAAVPATQTCMGCHKLVAKDSPKLAVVRESYSTGKPIPWVKVHMLPDYAKFNHSAHINVGVGCTSCHGRIDKMKVVGQVKPLSMGWCLECHRNPKPNLRPLSEVTNMEYNPKEAGYDPDTDPHRNRQVNPPQHCSACHH